MFQTGKYLKVLEIIVKLLQEFLIPQESIQSVENSPRVFAAPTNGNSPNFNSNDRQAIRTALDITSDM